MRLSGGNGLVLRRRLLRKQMPASEALWVVPLARFLTVHDGSVLASKLVGFSTAARHCGVTRRERSWESTFGTKRTWQSRSAMSAFGGKADIAGMSAGTSSVPGRVSLIGGKRIPRYPAAPVC